MGQRNDCKLNALQTQLAKTGQLNDLFLEWLQVNGATSDDLNDAQIEMLVSQGYTEGSLNDRWYVFLGALGYTGALADRFQQWWCGESGDGSDGGQIVSYLINLPLLINRYNTGDNAYNATLDRNSAATVIDHEGIVRTCLPNEFRFQGARRVEQLFISQDFDNAPWQKFNGVTVNGNVVSFNGTSNGRLSADVAIVGRDYQASIRCRIVGGVIPSDLRIATKLGSAENQIYPTTEWQTLGLSIIRANSNSALGLRDHAGEIFDIEVEFFQGEDVTDQSNTSPSDFITLNDSACSVSDIPVRYYDTTNGNTVDANGVVTEAAGVALPEPEGSSVWEESTNYCTQSSDVTQWATTSDCTLDDYQTITFGTTALARSAVPDAIAPAAGNIFTVSVYVWCDSGTEVVRLRITESGVASYDSPNKIVTTTKQRIEITSAAWTATAGLTAFLMNGSDNIARTIHVEGFQIEKLSYSTPLIRTSGAAATRLADNPQTSWPSGLVNDFVLGCDAEYRAFPTVRRILEARGAGYYMLRYRNNNTEAQTFKSGSLASNVAHGLSDGEIANVKGRQSATQGNSIFINDSLNNTEATQTADIPLPTVLHIGAGNSGQENLNGNIKNINLRKGDLTDDEVING